MSCKDGHNKGQKWYGLTDADNIKKRWQQYTEELYKKDLHDSDNLNIVSLTWSQTAWSAKSSGPWEALPETKLVEVIEFQLSYFKS